MRLYFDVAASTSSAADARVGGADFAERDKYRERSERRAKKGSEREAETLKILAAFQTKMERSRRLAEYVSAGVADEDADDDGSDKKEEDEQDDDNNDLSWFVSTKIVCVM